jgi:CHASE1-domain containing sensor protein
MNPQRHRPAARWNAFVQVAAHINKLLAWCSPWLLMVATLSVTLHWWNWEDQQLRRESAAAFDILADDVPKQAVARLDAYAKALRATRSFIEVTPEVDGARLAAFIASLQLAHDFPGLPGIGFLPTHASQGGPVFFDGVEDRRRLSNRSPLLFRHADRGPSSDTIPEGKRAFELPRDKDTVKLSPKMKLGDGNGNDIDTGFIMYLPVFEPAAPGVSAAPRQIGWLYNAVRYSIR